jgi:hypothetical protein
MKPSNGVFGAILLLVRKYEFGKKFANTVM